LILGPGFALGLPVGHELDQLRVVHGESVVAQIHDFHLVAVHDRGREGASHLVLFNPKVLEVDEVSDLIGDRAFQRVVTQVQRFQGDQVPDRGGQRARQAVVLQAQGGDVSQHSDGLWDGTRDLVARKVEHGQGGDEKVLGESARERIAREV